MVSWAQNHKRLAGNPCGSFYLTMHHGCKGWKLPPASLPQCWRRFCLKPPLFLCVLSRVCLFATPWIVARHVFLSMGFPRQEYWTGLPFPTPGVVGNFLLFPTQGLNPHLLHLLHLSGGFFTNWQEPLFPGPSKPSPLPMTRLQIILVGQLFKKLSDSFWYLAKLIQLCKL